MLHRPQLPTSDRLTLQPSHAAPPPGRNQLSSVPPELGMCAGLRTLELRDNKLTGIPAEVRRRQEEEAAAGAAARGQERRGALGMYAHGCQVLQAGASMTWRLCWVPRVCANRQTTMRRAITKGRGCSLPRAHVLTYVHDICTGLLSSNYR